MKLKQNIYSHRSNLRDKSDEKDFIYSNINRFIHERFSSLCCTEKPNPHW